MQGKYLHIIGVIMFDEQTTQTDQKAVSLNLSDLVMAVQAIQLASTRGAFRPEDFIEVGECYKNIVAFLAASGAVSTTPTNQQEGNQND